MATTTIATPTSLPPPASQSPEKLPEGFLPPSGINVPPAIKFIPQPPVAEVFGKAYSNAEQEEEQEEDRSLQVAPSPIKIKVVHGDKMSAMTHKLLSLSIVTPTAITTFIPGLFVRGVCNTKTCREGLEQRCGIVWLVESIVCEWSSGYKLRLQLCLTDNSTLLTDDVSLLHIATSSSKTTVFRTNIYIIAWRDVAKRLAPIQDTVFSLSNLYAEQVCGAINETTKRSYARMLSIVRNIAAEVLRFSIYYDGNKTAPPIPDACMFDYELKGKQRCDDSDDTTTSSKKRRAPSNSSDSDPECYKCLSKLYHCVSMAKNNVTPAGVISRKLANKLIGCLPPHKKVSIVRNTLISIVDILDQARADSDADSVAVDSGEGSGCGGEGEDDDAEFA